MPASAAVLQVLPALRSGGVERGTVEIARALVAGGFRAFVASAGGALAEEVEAAGAQHVTLPLHRKSPLALWRNAAALSGLIREEGIGIVHARSRFPAWSALIAARRSGAHFVTTYHGVYSEDFPGKRFYNSVMARGERVIAISEHVAGVIRGRYGVGPDRLRLIPRGVEVDSFDPARVSPARAEALRRRWGIPAERPVVMLPGRLTRWKGQGVLLRALARPEAAGAFGVLVGEGAYRAELERDIAALGLTGRVVMPGVERDMPAALTLADLVIHASTKPEPFGRTVIEAQAMERPVIASDLGAPRETVEQGVTGWRVAPDDPAALAAAIGQALALPEAERQAMGRRARMAVEARYTTAAMQEATLAVYRELL
ncbi:glycosyltransferase family 4 protein [Roseomonas elaeocarpi]|uniref:Glycosyltransferase family 4 protein n=1 Tax=Roseomonas elaeocarpi TaxID=907779 RepID=A0ABV6JVF4_9PROT